MKPSRREFVAASLAGVAALCTKDGVTSAFAAQNPLPPEDGYKLWLRYAPLGTAGATTYGKTLRQLVVEGTSPTAGIIRTEVGQAVASMLGAPLPLRTQDLADGALVVGTPGSSPLIRALGWQGELQKLGPEGFVIRTARIDKHPVIAVASDGEIGALYGTFHLLRLMQTLQPLDRVNVAERPKVQIRMLNHWDNLNGSVERGYAGRSLWQWNDLPNTIDPRYADYARANASIGINGASPNNVNADVRVLSPEYLAKVAALAGVWRPYGVRMYLSANVAAPMRLGGLKTADPLDKDVAAWWKTKVDEIYGVIPDFGGFVVKANSEGQPGPKDYGRSHAEGANVLADALAPHGGNVIWRAFIYDEDVDPDRAKRAYIEFTKLDGQFKPNVLVQVKNGAIDFQPREPFHPLFGALTRTPVLAEIQATQEYLGQAKHLVYLGTMWEEFLDADTFAKGKGSTVGKAIEGAVHPYRVTGMVSVVNPGLDRNWCGHHFSQSNWYASGRLAWNPELSAQQIADEWTRMTFTNDPKTVETIRTLMMGSRETFVNYTMPLGLHHLIGGNHYAPMPENAKDRRADWTAAYYHQASVDGIGFDRTMKGDKAVGQYFPPVRDRFDSLETCPEEFLLWFHRVPWDYRLKSGKTLWAGLCEKYTEGARQAAAMQATWTALEGHVDAQRHKEVAERLAIQVADAATWRDHILEYFQQFSKQPIVDK
ncbi:MAG TPA: alpha-glucuronidase family glycosyl hydrolase [Vicinamibacterales bacterium]|nr:alpha-glucuronidase family glycosyl hydrolase [Vicinamibacterales bacterium]